ncbi:DUF885 family protein [Erythrobacter sp. JK5]|uniref:DUF885 domain-containing protein n=1 Tax=Erythrobacter sp. JK5 TaxID=2829500 RepID=UPI001BA4F088|nr:DUF885 domain-containing protein [Erythrobacter sp. JK5]QUL37630.1 DUF885 domain-containing protein [Erythrobacter sp. JK5]
MKSIYSRPIRILAAAAVTGIAIAGGQVPKAFAQDTVQESGSAVDEAPVTRLRSLADRHVAIILGASPEWATQLGVDEEVAGEGFAARLSSYSPKDNDRLGRDVEAMLAELRTIDRDSLTASDRVTYDVMLNAYELAAQQNKFGVGLPSMLSAGAPYAVNQLFGPQVDLPRLLIAQHPLNNRKDAQDWLARLSEIDRVLDELADAAQEDAQKGVVPPYFALEAIAASARSFAAGSALESPLMNSFSSRLATIDDLTEVERARYEAQAAQLLGTEVFPAYIRFGDRIAQLVPEAGSDAGLWRLPRGEAMYRVAIEAWGANGLSPDEIHEIGVADVARIQRQMDEILREVGYTEGTVGERMTQLARDPAYLIEDTDEAKATLIGELQRDVDRVMALSPNWFKRVPQQQVEVRRIPSHEQDASSGGYYTPPPLDGSRPGIFWINMKSAADIPTYTLRSLVFHEAVPGHHFQASAALSIEGLPLLQNMMWFGDYGEGWALYAEELAKEMGLYEGDRLGDLGRLRMENYRAARLVVDTGIHHKRWSREEAIDYMVGVTGESRESIQREIDRYAVWPGQAASYKLGMIQFQRLRARAESELGDKFDIREFHDLVLREGPMPMAVLARRVEAWINEQKGQ